MAEVRWVDDTIKLVIDGDLVHVTSYRTWTYDQTVEYFKILDGVRAANEKLFIIVNTEKSRGIPEQRVRSYVATWSAKNTFSGMAIYGVDAITRSIAILIFNAANMFRRGSATMAIVKDEAAARQWIEERRAELLRPRR